MIKSHNLLNKLHIAVIGGNGFIGRHFIHRLANQESLRIWSLDTRKHNVFLGLKDHKAIIHQVQMDVSIDGSFQMWLAANDVDIVVYCAGCDSPTDGLHYNYGEEVRTLKALSEVLNTFEYLHKGDADRQLPYFIYLSSATVYGTNRRKISTEKDPLFPANYSGMIKMTAEDLIGRVTAKLNIPSVILRLSEVYGRHHHKELRQPGQWRGYLQYVVDQVVRRQESIDLFSPDTKIDLVNVNYVTKFMADCLVNLRTGVYNIGSGQATSLRELYSTIKQSYGETSPSTLAPSRRLRVEDQLIDVSKSHSLVPYDHEKYNLEKFIEAYIPVRRYEIAKDMAISMIMSQKYTLDTTAYGAVDAYYERQRDRTLKLGYIREIAGPEFEKIDYGRFQERAKLLLSGEENKLATDKALEHRARVQLSVDEPKQLDGTRKGKNKQRQITER